MLARLPAFLTVIAVVLGATAAQAQTLSIVDGRLAVDSRPRFLLFVSYFHGLERPPETLAADLAWLASKGVGGIRVWPNAAAVRLMNPDGTLDPRGQAAFNRLLAEAARHRLIVDVTFTRESLCPRPDGCSLTADGYKRAIAEIARSLRGGPTAHGHVLFDLQNEANLSERSGLTLAALSAIRDEVKAANPSLPVTASTSGLAPAESAAHVFDLLADHEPRDHEGRWAENTAARVAGLRRHLDAAGKRTVPIYLQEPNRFRAAADTETYYDNNPASYLTAARQARDAGAAAWTFHTAACFDLASTTPFADLLQPGEREVVERLADALASADDRGPR